MRTAKARPIIRIHTHYDGRQPLVEAYADVFTLILQTQRDAKSSIRTFEGSKPFHYDFSRKQKESDRNGTTD